MAPPAAARAAALLLLLSLACCAAASGEVTPKIVGGIEAPINRFKHQLGFQAGDAVCGASLIRDNVAVTGAHCFDFILSGQATSTNLVVWAGGHTAWFGNGPTDAVPYPVEHYVIHPAYSHDAAGAPVNDVALLFLKNCTLAGPAVGPIKIASQQESDAAAGSDVAVTGWGSTSLFSDQWGQSGLLALNLQYGVLRRANCTQYNITVNATTAFCGLGYNAVDGGSVPQQDTCQGDSGGPAIFNVGAPSDPMSGSPDGDRLLGVTSWGDGCGQPGTPGAYTFLPAFIPWIEAEVAKVNKTCTAANTGPERGPGGIGTAFYTLWYGYLPRSTAAVWAARASKSIIILECKAGASPADEATCGEVARRSCTTTARPGGWPAVSVRSRPFGPKGGTRLRFYCDLFKAVPARLCAPKDALAPCKDRPWAAFELGPVGLN